METDRIIRAKDFKRIYQILDYVRSTEEFKRKKSINNGNVEAGKGLCEFYTETVLDILKNTETFE